MAMVQCFQLPEIVRSICDESTKAASLSMALTCRSSLGPALDSLWRDVDSFNAIAATLPRDLWHWQRRMSSNTSIPVVSFMRGIKLQDLERYLTFYARRIRRLAPVLSSRDKIFSIEFFQSLQLVTYHKIGVLAPSLKELRWPSFSDAHSWLGHDFCRLLPPYVSLFLGDRISRFVAFDYGLHPHSILLSFISTHLQNLKELDLRALKGGRIDGISDSCWSSLEHLKLGRDTGSFLSNLAHSTRPARLLSLCLEAHSFMNFPNDSRPPPATINSFPSLRVVSIRTSFPMGIPELLTYLVCPDNVVAAFVCKIELSDAPQSFRRVEDRNLGHNVQHIISHTVGSCNRQTLQRLVITEPRNLAITEAQNNNDDDSIVEDEDEDDEPRSPVIRRPCQATVFSEVPIDIKPLYSFHKLRVLDIRLCKVCIPIGPEEVLALSAAWPALEVLNLCPDFPCLQRLPSINHTHIIRLLDYCPSLRELGLRFDTTQIMEWDLKALPEKWYPRLRTLRVGDSPISSHWNVVWFIRMYFPRLEELHTIAAGPTRPDMSTWEWQWLAVVKGAWRTPR